MANGNKYSHETQRALSYFVGFRERDINYRVSRNRDWTPLPLQFLREESRRKCVCCALTGIPQLLWEFESKSCESLEKYVKELSILLTLLDPNQITIVLCGTQNHYRVNRGLLWHRLCAHQHEGLFIFGTPSTLRHLLLNAIITNITASQPTSQQQE